MPRTMRNRPLSHSASIAAIPAPTTSPSPSSSAASATVPVRNPKKLPAKTARVSYDLEYGTDALEIHLDAIAPGQRVILVDDLLATGGTMQATVQLVRQLGGEIAGLGFAIELDFLKGRAKFPEYDVFSLLHYDE